MNRQEICRTEEKKKSCRLCNLTSRTKRRLPLPEAEALSPRRNQDSLQPVAAASFMVRTLNVIAGLFLRKLQLLVFYCWSLSGWTGVLQPHPPPPHTHTDTHQVVQSWIVDTGEWLNVPDETTVGDRL